MKTDVVAIGASAGGVEALRVLAGRLPADFAAAVLVTLHVNPSARSLLPELLDRAGPLPAAHARHGEPVKFGRILVAPPDAHLMLADGQVVLSRGPRESGSRPSINAMFRSVARSFRDRAAGVLLSGTLDDGTAGLELIRARGGVTLVQSPETAAYPQMPRNAVEAGAADQALHLAEIATELVSLAGTDAGLAGRDVASGGVAGPGVADEPGTLARLAAEVDNYFSCPDCGGVLHPVGASGPSRQFACQVGHAWSPESLLAAQLEHVEESLWAALRALEEHRKLTLRMLSDIEARAPMLRRRYEERLRDLELDAARIRAILLQPGSREADASSS